MPSERFTLFSSLPTEIRLKIWHASFEPRLVDHSMLYDYYRKRPKPPPALYVNHESRMEALAVYTCLFIGAKWARPWVSATLDTIQIPFSTFPGAPHFRRLAEENAEFHVQVKNLTVYCQNLATSEGHMTYRIDQAKKEKEWTGNDPIPIFKGVDEIVFNFHQVEVEKTYVPFLHMVRNWYNELRKTKLWSDLEVPKVMKAVGREGVVLAVMKREDEIAISHTIITKPDSENPDTPP